MMRRAKTPQIMSDKNDFKGSDIWVLTDYHHFKLQFPALTQSNLLYHLTSCTARKCNTTSSHSIEDKGEGRQEALGFAWTNLNNLGPLFSCQLERTKVYQTYS